MPYPQSIPLTNPAPRRFRDLTDPEIVAAIYADAGRVVRTEAPTIMRRRAWMMKTHPVR